MGSPLGPTFANFYMSHVEKFVFDKKSLKKPSIYFRYVDDIFLLVDSVSDLKQLLNHFTKASCLNFTYEIENSDKSINFLDVKLMKSENNKTDTTVNHKQTESAKILDFKCFAPITYKKAVLKGELYRIFRICNSYTELHKEICLLEKKNC